MKTLFKDAQKIYRKEQKRKEQKEIYASEIEAFAEINEIEIKEAKRIFEEAKHKKCVLISVLISLAVLVITTTIFSLLFEDKGLVVFIEIIIVPISGILYYNVTDN